MKFHRQASRRCLQDRALQLCLLFIPETQRWTLRGKTARNVSPCRKAPGRSYSYTPCSSDIHSEFHHCRVNSEPRTTTVHTFPDKGSKMDALMPNLKLQSDAQNVEKNGESEPWPSVTNSSENSVKEEVKEEVKKEVKEEVKKEVKIEVKKEVKEEVKEEVKDGTSIENNKSITEEEKLRALQEIEGFLEEARANKRQCSVLTDEEEPNIEKKHKIVASNEESMKLLSKILHKRSSMHPKRFSKGSKIMIINDGQKEIARLQFQCIGPSDLQGIVSAVEEIFPNASFDIPFLLFLSVWKNGIDVILKSVTTKADESTEVDDRTDHLCFIANVDISHKPVKIYSQIRNYLKALANEHATDITNAKVKQILENEHVPIQLIISYRRVTERYMNADISVGTLQRHMKKIKRDKLAVVAEGYFVYICKKFKVTNKYTKKTGFIWLYSEEELFAEEALCSFEYPVEPELFKLPDLFKPDDYETVIPYRQVLIFESIELQKLIPQLVVADGKIVIASRAKNACTSAKF